MTQVSIHEAKTHLSRLIEKVMNGEEVIISKRHVPVARIEKIIEPLVQRRVGGLKGVVRRMGSDFDRSVPDMETWMEAVVVKGKAKSRKLKL